MRLLTKFIIVSLVIAAAPRLSDGITVGSVEAAAIAAVVYGVLFVFVGWAVTLLVGLLSIVPGVLTLGLFFLLLPTLVNMVLLKMTAGLIAGFQIQTWGSAFFLSAVLGVVNWLFESRDDDSRRRHRAD